MKLNASTPKHQPQTLNPAPKNVIPKTVRAFEVDEGVQAEEAIKISWDLCFDPTGYMLVFRQVSLSPTPPPPYPFFPPLRARHMTRLVNAESACDKPST